MSLADLPTLAEISAIRRAVPKHQLATRLDVKATADRDDAKALETWRKAVARRDRNRCRVCGVLTVSTLALDPKRREIHHIVSRTNPVTRTDVRNGLTVCLKDHQRLTRHKLFILGTVAQMYKAGRGMSARWYLNGDLLLTFSDTRKET